MLAFMPPDSADCSLGATHWYGSGGPHALGALPGDGPRSPMMMRRAPEAVVHSQQFPAFHSQEPRPWTHSAGALHLDPSTLGILPQSSSAAAIHKAPLAPKQGLADSLANSRDQHQSPIAGTYALRTPRGKITSIACESCRKRKSKCDGVRPKCNTCQSRNLACVYDVAEDGKTTTQLRAHVRRLAKELADVKSIVSLLALAPDRVTAATWANELQKNGFAHYSAEEMKKTLQEVHEQQHLLQESESLSTPGSEQFPRHSHSVSTSSYDSSSREASREHSQPALAFPPHAMDGAAPFGFNVSTELGKFSFDCAYYRKTKREMLANGWDEAQVFGRHEMDVDTILLGFADPQDGQPVPTWSSQTVNKLLPAVPLPVRLASTFLLTKIMRWLIWPSVENMNAMPEWLRPLARQDRARYDILVDLIPWPRVRRHLYQHPGDFVVGAFVGFIGLNWPYADDACHYWDIGSGHTQMTPFFVSALRDLSNWTLDAKALEIMPQIEGLVSTKT